ncbi:MAG: Amidase [Actinoallomurus sp.]|nr:Amidase [Actinoallomurus sp.]
MTQELAYQSATELAAAVRSREVSPVEVVDYFLDRIAERNPSLNAFVFLAADEARKAARRAEKAVSDGDELGPLHGVPTALKDLFDFNPGWPSTYGGIPALRDNVTQLHCTYARRMKEAGAILLGKTNSPVMGFRGTCDNPLFGPTRNPFDPSRNSGGSSGGSAAAVADGLLPLAEGTDGGGSVRIPASWCGVVGYKASFGRVPFVTRPNAFGGSVRSCSKACSRVLSRTPRSAPQCSPGTTRGTRSPSTRPSTISAPAEGHSTEYVSPTAPTSACTRWIRRSPR